ncbi:MAG TPA: NAD(P)/FAD-dependent oxidoreductase, partial [Candidatus Binatia bacterium]|nr:NAD(P)/FAD-dependent oxidoreductase [Candidatus Binatia bacterium]
QQFPREKLCGDFVNPVNWPLFRKLGVEEEILSNPHEKITTFCVSSLSGDDVKVPLNSRPAALFGLGLRRSSLDHVLLKKAASDGALLFQSSRVTELTKARKGWDLTIDNSGTVKELHARILIGADGRNSWVAHHLGLAGGAAAGKRSVGFQLRLKSSGLAGGVEVHLFPGGYAGVVGLGDGTLNLACAISPSLLFQRGVKPLTEKISPLERGIRGDLTWLESLLSQNPRLREILRRSERVGKIRSVYPVYFPPRRPYANGVLLAGDAARVSEPVTGEGIYFALKSGMLAAETLDGAFCRGDSSASQLKSYARACDTVFRRRLRLNSLIRFLMHHSALLSAIIRASAKRRRLLDSMVQLVCAPDT